MEEKKLPDDETSPKIFTREQHDAFQTDGYIVVRGMLTEDEVARLSSAGDATCARAAKQADDRPKDQFTVIERAIMFDCRDEEGTPCTSNPFREVAVKSQFAPACAELMQLDPATQNMRILRDVFLAKPVDSDNFCDWHVDDQGFWPESFLSSASSKSGLDQNGINVWIAMDDMPKEFEGSMAVCPGSHRADWRHAGYKAIGQNRNKPGGLDKEEMKKMFANPARRGGGTCTLGVTDTDLWSVIEESKRVLDLKKGDAIFATRLLFHRTVPVTPAGREHFHKMGKDALNRYSIRYCPGSAALPGGFSAEYSMVHNENLQGRTLDEVDEIEGLAWYPKVWPTPDDDLFARMDDLASDMLPDIKEKAKASLKEVFGRK